MLVRAIQRFLLRPRAAHSSPLLATTSTALSPCALSRAITTAPPPFTPPSSETTPPIPDLSDSSPTAQPDAPPSPHPSLALLMALKSQPSQYITIHIQGFPFLVTPGDLVRLPFRLKDVNVGDILRITHASVLGSRDYTLKGSPFIDPNLFECRATVVEETSEPMRIKEKKKQRNRRIKTVKSKHRYTVLRIKELILHDPPEMKGPLYGTVEDTRV